MRTRQAILEAAAELELVHGGALDPHVWTFARIAELAGVSERTVYRFFPSRADLDRAFAEEAVLWAGVDPARSLEEQPARIEEVMRRWSRRFDNVRLADDQPDSEDFPAFYAARVARDRRFLESLVEMFPEMEEWPERQRLGLAAAIQSLSSVPVIVLSARRWGLTLEEAGSAHAFALRSLLQALRVEFGRAPGPSPDVPER